LRDGRHRSACSRSRSVGLVLTPLGLLGRYAAAVGYLFLFGGLTGLGLSQLTRSCRS
jgi:hypothetical protein